MKVNRVSVCFFVFLTLFFSCGNGQGKKPTPTPQTDPKISQIFSEEIVKDFVRIEAPKEGIIGDATDLTFPTNESYWKGVFVKGRTVKLTPFYMAKYEVCYKIWKEVYDWAIQNGYKFNNPGKKGGARYKKYNEAEHSEMEPVTTVNWRDCIVWCNAYTQKLLGNEEHCVYQAKGETLKDATVRELFDELDTVWELGGFRLPTEAEWEFCARYQGEDATNAVKLGEAYYTRLDSASGAKKPLGFKKLKYEGASKDNQALWDELRDETARVCVYRWFFTGEDFGGNDFEIDKEGYENPAEKGYSKFTPDIEGTAKVGSRQPNSLGLYDMSGNVSEWLYDIFCSAPEDPIVEIDPEKASPYATYSENLHVIKGSSWANWSFNQAVGSREGDDEAKTAGEQLGFRLVYRLPKK